MANIGVLGVGTWGMALARMLSNSGHDVTVWSAIEKVIEDFSKTRKHPNILRMDIPKVINFTKTLQKSV